MCTFTEGPENHAIECRLATRAMHVIVFILAPQSLTINMQGTSFQSAAMVESNRALSCDILFENTIKSADMICSMHCLTHGLNAK